MNLKFEKSTLILISIMFFLLIFSVIMYSYVDNNLVRRVLFFPDKNNFSGEIRQLPEQESQEENIKVLINELILGPYSIDHHRTVPEKTRLHSILLRNKSTLYIDFSADLIVSVHEHGIVCSDMLKLIRKNLKYNFPILEEITLSVDGQTLLEGLN